MNPQNKPLILLVDDNPTNLRLLASIFSENYEIALATDGMQTLEMVKDTIPDLILLDVMMPDMDGYEVCEKLKKIEAMQTVPIIFLTGKTEISDIVKAFNVGGVDYVAKPFIKEELVARVSAHLKVERLVKELEIANQMLLEMANTDMLTNIPNRRYILNRLEDELRLAKRHQVDLAILMIDIDFFKRINDNYGHETGDKVLINVARTIKETIRTTDLLGRIGGEEFLLVFPHTSLDNALVVAEKVRLAVQSIIWEQPELNISISGGLVAGNPDQTINRLLIDVDNLLYKAKESGRNCIFSAESPS